MSEIQVGYGPWRVTHSEDGQIAMIEVWQDSNGEGSAPVYAYYWLKAAR